MSAVKDAAVPVRLVDGCEVVEVEAEGGEIVLVDQRSCGVAVVLLERIAEPAALGDQDDPFVAPQLPGGHSEQHGQERQVEDEISGLLHPPSLGGHLPASGTELPPNGEVLTAQVCCYAVARLFRSDLEEALVVVGESMQVSGHQWRSSPQPPDVLTASRQEAADE